MGEKGGRDFHFNVNVRTNTGSIARLANSEDPFLRAMEIQERKREKIEEEQKRLEAEKKAEEQAAPEITPESVENAEGGPTAEAAGSEDSSETPVTQDEAAGSPETTAETPVTAKPATAKPASPKPSGGGYLDQHPEQAHLLRKNWTPCGKEPKLTPQRSKQVNYDST